MKRIPVRSSNLVSVGYEPESLTLEIEFATGIYQYFQVPENVYSDLMDASSIGNYFNQHIKDVYSCNQV